ncbi:hypothetical protein LV89_04932 [Arcicella aurantiaca]|uniref:DUF3846 domain-containing protein n=1 Tax=Arcicella aurantiaca TaxID=591202 RepID=A0A316DD17_9BACT|nr:hypothetical protein [Arcicella aurantiaca]PWK16117.1 hypothetical protein LV89_04932 [Arcicella aurantiaca]
MKQIQGIFIDVKNQIISEKTILRGLTPIYELLNCQIVDIIHLSENSGIYVDDEGLLVAEDKVEGYFKINGKGQFYAGSGLLLGFDESGEDISSTLTVEEVKQFITFYSPEQVPKEAKEPQMIFMTLEEYEIFKKNNNG